MNSIAPRSIIACWMLVCGVCCLVAPNEVQGQADDKSGLSEFLRQGQSKWIESAWTGRFGNGNRLKAQDLSDIVANHELWLKTDRARGARANLSGATLSGAYLARRNLAWAVLEGVTMSEANLFGAVLIRADIRNSRLERVNLMYAKLSSVDLSGAKLERADLSNSDLSGANLGAANLRYANLRAAVLQDADLSGTDLMGAQGLTELRKQFKEAGSVSLAKQMTYQIRRTDRIASWYEGAFGKVDSVFNLFMFEVPCKYGYSPGRALVLLLSLIPLFSVAYVYALAGETHAAIWKVQEIGQEEKRSRLRYRGVLAVTMGLYFSLLSAFEIGWKEFTVSNWITRLQATEYSLASSGWVRPVSGIQSLISVYLLALWALTYFGAPFE
jgi:uncharacterized protein YjbI with pentapeptide repeats